MSTVGSTPADVQRTMRQAIRAHWLLFLIQGLVMVVLGLAAIAEPMLATLAVTIFAGWLFLIAGIVGLAGVFTAWKTPGIVWTLIRALVAILAGVLLLARPLAGILTLTIILAAFFAAQGVTQIIVAIKHRAMLPSWGWVLVSGIIDLVLAAIIISGWPETAEWVLGLLVGVNLFMSGLALAMTAVACRSVGEGPATTARA
ncbi:MAG TPA: HdeD family acid-resistance protein [Xanthobacteraceae bacterium]|nr:HdeD family acid-resistance protein [Xanthobacteraceae bacterium]